MNTEDRLGSVALALVGSLALVSCSESAATPPATVSADVASNVQMADVGNAENGTDLEVSFDAAVDEGTVRAYRVIVAKASGGALTVAAAEQLVADRYVEVMPQDGPVTVTLGASSVDADGDLIENAEPYRASILSVPDGTIATEGALSFPSPALALNSTASAASAIVVDDPTNAGNGTDLLVQFTRAVDETSISEYGIFVVPEGAAADFTVDSAEALPADRSTDVAKAGLDIALVLPADARATDGSLVRDSMPYRVFVLSKPDGVVASKPALAGPSAPIMLAFTTVKITYLGNDGVLISDGTHQVLIDALHRVTAGWITLPPAEQNRLESAQVPYDSVDLVLITHNHGDHHNPSALTSFLVSNGSAFVIGPPQVLGGLAGTGNVLAINPSFQTRFDTTVSGIDVSVVHLRHFNQFGNDFSNVENFGYLVTLGGKQFLHLGDFDYASDNLDALGLSQDDIDVVFIPTFNTLISAGNRDLVLNAVQPAQVVGLHFQAPLVETESAAVLSLFDDVTVFTESLMFLRR